MNALKLRIWSERQQVLAVILLVGALIFLVWFFALLPLNRERRSLESEIEDMTAQLEAKNYLRGEDALLREKETEVNHNRAVHAEWVELSNRLAAFANQQRFAGGSVHRIDFKVDLFAVRQRLLAKSKALNISLPRDIGMDEEVNSDEDARVLMLQLRTVERLVDLILDLKINTLRHIERLPPQEHRVNPKDPPYLEEYLVRLDFYGSLENLFDLFHAVLQPPHVFFLKNLRVEALNPHENLFNVTAVMSSLLFVRDPDQIVTTPVKTNRRAPPGGY
jgi:hypothetical protein